MTHTMTTGCLIINNKFKLSALRSTRNVAYNRVYILQWFHLVMFWKASIRMYMQQYTRIVSGLSDYSHRIMYTYILDQGSPAESDLINLMIFSHSLPSLSLSLSASKFAHQACQRTRLLLSYCAGFVCEELERLVTQSYTSN